MSDLLHTLDRHLATLKPFFDDPDVVEIYQNPHDSFVRLRTLSAGRTTTSVYLHPTVIRRWLNALAHRDATTLHDGVTQFSAELPPEAPWCRARLQAHLPPACRHESFVIRKHARSILTFDDFLRQGLLDPPTAAYLRQALADRLNVLIAGGTATGKTTFLNALLHQLADLHPGERIVALEDLPELRVANPDHLLLTSDNPEGLQDLVRHTLRSDPDRIIVGEVRGKEALNLVDAWLTGHPGGLATIHGTTAHAALRRLDLLLQRNDLRSNPHLIAEAIDLVVVLQGKGPNRRILELARVVGHDGTTYQLQTPLNPGAPR